MTRLIIPFLFLIVLDIYFFQSIRTVASVVGDKWRIAIYLGYWLLTGITLVAVYVAATGGSFPNHIRYYLLSFVLVLVVPKVVGVVFMLGEDVFRIGSGTLRSFGADSTPFLQSRRMFVSQVGLMVAAIPFTALLYGMAKTAFDFTVRKKTIHFADLPPAFDGLKVLQISDMHSGSFASPSYITKAIDKILEQKADIIFFTGDLVNNEASEAEPFLNELSRLKAPLGVFSILGNHDYGDYGPWPSEKAKVENLQRLKDLQKDAGWNLLLNSNHTINKNNEELAIVGVENWGASRHFPKYGDLDKAVSGVENVPFKILLSHDPSHWDAQIKQHPQEFQLTLSGHTHGFQFGIEIPGFKWSPVQYIYKQWAGLYKDGGQHIYVNRGLGFLGYMGRVGISPEITVLELRSEEIA
ncbi:MAG: metallophosphoesterase [Flavobacteriales bacterium]|nr:metallophosphoesterase [Flavobacteriales bacterium]